MSHNMATLTNPKPTNKKVQLVLEKERQYSRVQTGDEEESDIMDTVSDDDADTDDDDDTDDSDGLYSIQCLNAGKDNVHE